MSRYQQRPRSPERKIRESPIKKKSRVFDVQKINQVKNNLTEVPDADPRACSNRSTWSPAINMQQPRLGTSHLILGDSLVRVLQNLRTSWITRVTGVQRQTEMNPITIVFAGINDHLHSRGFLNRFREPSTAEDALWPAIKDILESMGEVMDTLKENAFTKITPRAVFALSPGYAHLPDALKFVYAMEALLSEGKYDVIISAPNRGLEMVNLRPLRAELPAVWAGISNAMQRFEDHSLHVLVLDEVLGLELSNFSRQLKLKPGIDDDHRVIVAMSNDLWFRGMEIK